MNRVGLLEDHDRMTQLIRKALAGAGIEVDAYTNIAHAWDGFSRVAYSALIIDRGVPDGDGIDLLRRLRDRGLDTPCLMLTARDALHDRVAGLEAGADDYLPKPFSMEELVARIRALMRRPPLLQSLAPEYAGLQIAPELACMRFGVESVSLAPSELQFMLCLVKAQGRPVRRAALETAAWGLTEAVTPNALDVALHRLRKKLQAIDAPLGIANLRGYGFALQESADAA
ncbi:MAG: response regulator transcription factor [Collimonas sp.]|uniref:response regulator transcription factor n=1 Tax=Collimonas sp. TaxID=1963772 RepID=UPI0032642376